MNLESAIVENLVMTQIPEDDLELQEAANKLASLLGLNKASLENLLSGSLATKEVKPRVHVIKDKEYILLRKETCTCCYTVSIQIFIMKQLGSSSVLYAEPVSEIPVPNSRPIREENVFSKTCPECIQNLILLSKLDLALMYLEAINKTQEVLSLNSCLVEDLKFQALQEAKKRRSQNG